MGFSTFLAVIISRQITPPLTQLAVAADALCQVRGEIVLVNPVAEKYPGKTSRRKLPGSISLRGAFDLLLLDLTIPGGMGGKDAIAKILAFDPSARAIVTSGYTQDDVMSHFQKYGFKRVIQKPFTLQIPSAPQAFPVLERRMSGVGSKSGDKQRGRGKTATGRDVDDF